MKYKSVYKKWKNDPISFWSNIANDIMWDRFPETILNEIYDFLNIKYPKNIELKIHNSGGYEKVINFSTIKKLKEFYAPFNEKFFNIIGKKFDWS